VADLLGGEGPSPLVAEDSFGVQRGLGASTSRAGLVAMSVLCGLPPGCVPRSSDTP
jgi:hypothetical protein